MQWTKTVSGSGAQNILSIATDVQGNVYSTGWHTGSMDFDPGIGVSILTSNGSSDIFVTKFDAIGNFVWARNYGSTAADEGISITVSIDGSIYVTGHYQSTVGFGSTNLISQGSFDCFALKLDSSGNVMWARSFGGASTDFSSSITSDQAGNIYVGGTFGGTVDFDPGPGVLSLTSSGSTDIFICKLNATGNLIWARALGGSITETLGDLEVDRNNRLYITGSFRSTVDFDVNSGVQNRTANAGFTNDNFIVKWDTASNFMWVHTFGSTGAESSKSMSITPSNELINVGNFSSTVDFNPDSIAVFNLTAAGFNAMYVLKLDSNGSFVWAKGIGGIDNNAAFATRADDSGNVYLSGWFKDTVDFDPNLGVFRLVSLGNEDAFVMKMNHAGIFDWAVQYGGTGFQNATSLAIRPTDNYLLVGGVFNNAVDFDPGISTQIISSAGGSDGFIQLLNSTNSIVPVSFIGFTGKVIDKNTYLNWETASEINNQGFEVQRSVDGLIFEPIGFVNGYGNSAKNQQYEFVHAYSNAAYYRLKQMDFDGKSALSHIIRLSLVEKAITLYPNPSKNAITIQSPSMIQEMIIYDHHGKLMNQSTVIHANEWILNITEWLPGIYFMKIISEDGVQSIHKFYKQ
jgi:hypothetical protein